MANVRLDERAFRRLDKFANKNKKDEWKVWRTQFLTAVRECDTGFATSLIAYDKAGYPIEDTGLTPTLQQLSATLQARLINVTAKEAFAIVNATEGARHRSLATIGQEVRPSYRGPVRLAPDIPGLVQDRQGTGRLIRAGTLVDDASLPRT